MKQLADVIGDAKIDLKCVSDEHKGSVYQQIKNETLKKESSYDFWLHYKNLMRDLDPNRNGFITN